MIRLLETVSNQTKQDIAILDDLEEVHRDTKWHCQSKPIKKVRKKLLKRADGLFAQLTEGGQRIFLRTLAKRMREETLGSYVIRKEDIDTAVAHASLRGRVVPKQQELFFMYLGAVVFATKSTIMFL